MIKHKIYVKRQRQGLGEQGITSLCRRAIKATLQEEGVETPVEISVLVSDNKGIQEINNEHRGKDVPTDVLSFPTAVYKPGAFVPNEADIDPKNGCLHLGNIVLSSEKAQEQAAEYGHDITRELAFLMVHATLHLLGYDHESPEDQGRMRTKEEQVLSILGLVR
ncbi:MAG: rRNA maturation RNase YbeY [Oscillospiraceae bacterium]|nr:rRNA maturation RNase YbeY [Oscillospiraceae bacterium]